ncbi:Alpha/Beta hydrolase protein [Suillus clintonianus]|uniref:Alpha/Beta hydrolase protein n=1 Tax=Suillus clintonianus TaxID=1904413 RepID=UPI001B885CBD|nr:Alpha/Beta hydrolase protein [Suillus clintonianus]KAG2142362.1 Alpha/Beta hydrolase protein [Suillus clintonianus]
MVSLESFTRRTVKVPSLVRIQVRLDVWYYRPAGNGPHPVVIAGPGLTATKDAGLAAFGERWARDAGWASLIFDYRGFGDSEGEPRNVVDFESQLQDYQSVMSWARSRPQDFLADRIVVMGSAASGLQVAELVVNDGALAGGMAHCPILDAKATLTSTSTNLRLLFWAGVDCARKGLGLSPIFVRAVGNPGEFALLSSPSSLPGFTSMFAQGSTPFSGAPNLIAPRFVIDALGVRPGLRLKDARCPMLIVMAEEDDLIPASITRKMVDDADGRVQLVVVPCGHFEIMKGGKGFEANITAQVKFLQGLLAGAN